MTAPHSCPPPATSAPIVLAFVVASIVSAFAAGCAIIATIYDHYYGARP